MIFDNSTDKISDLLHEEKLTALRMLWEYSYKELSDITRHSSPFLRELDELDNKGIEINALEALRQLEKEEPAREAFEVLLQSMKNIQFTDDWKFRADCRIFGHNQVTIPPFELALDTTREALSTNDYPSLGPGQLWISHMKGPGPFRHFKISEFYGELLFSQCDCDLSEILDETVVFDGSLSAAASEIHGRDCHADLFKFVHEIDPRAALVWPFRMAIWNPEHRALPADQLLHPTHYFDSLEEMNKKLSESNIKVGYVV